MTSESSDTLPPTDSNGDSRVAPGVGMSESGIKAIQGRADARPDGSEGTSEWVDRGMQDVPVKDLPMPEGVTGPEDFNHHITHEDAVRATNQLETMKPAIDQGLDGEDFAQQDAAAGLDYAHGKQRIYDLYYGSDPIRLDKDGDRYDIVSGRHRIYAAKEQGLETIPAHLIEKVEK